VHVGVLKGPIVTFPRSGIGVRMRQNMNRSRWVVALVVLGAFAVNAASAGGASSSADRSFTTARWRVAMAKVPRPGGSGCFTASYPALGWNATKCKVAPTQPYVPASGVPDAARPASSSPVGAGNDYSAKVTGLMSSVTGSFANVSPNITETGQIGGKGVQIANIFALQLNTDDFTTAKCSDSTTPGCVGWQQFIYSRTSNSVFMQYWLVYHSSPCPSGGWRYYDGSSGGASGCYMNSPSATFSGAALTARDLATARLSASAANGGNDSVVLSNGTHSALVNKPDSVADLAQNWNTVEFAVVGDCCSAQAKFTSANTTLDARLEVTSGSLAAPQCVNEGFTNETNSLNLVGTPAISPPIGRPMIASRQTNGTATTASCATASPLIATAGPPAAAGRADGYLFAFANTPVGHITYNQAGNGGAFVGWQDVPGGLIPRSTVAAGEQGTTLVVFTRDAANHVVFNQAAKGGAFVGWQPVPGGLVTSTAPGAAGRADGYLFVFAVTPSGHIMFNQAAKGGAFVGWQEIPGGLITHTPVAAGEQGTTLVVFARRADGTIWFNQAAKGGAFVGWQPVPGGLITTTTPAAAGRADGYLFVFAVTPSGHVMFNQAAKGGAFVGWQEIPGGLTTNMSVAAGEQGTTLVVFARDSSGRLMFNQAAKGGAFVGWQQI
jgi:hypothetical protein